jgi:hypothetical protein
MKVEAGEIHTGVNLELPRKLARKPAGREFPERGAPSRVECKACEGVSRPAFPLCGAARYPHCNRWRTGREGRICLVKFQNRLGGRSFWEASRRRRASRSCRCNSGIRGRLVRHHTQSRRCSPSREQSRGPVREVRRDPRRRGWFQARAMPTSETTWSHIRWRFQR